MKRLLIKIVAVVFLIVFFQSKDVVLAAPIESKEKEIIIQNEITAAKDKETELLVQYKPGSKDKKSSFSQEGSSLIRKIKNIGSDTFVITPHLGADISKVKNELRKDKLVISIESNTKQKLHTAPNDPRYSKQWGLKTILAEEAWKNMPTAKQSVIVAVIDSGLELEHSDIKDRVKSGGYNFVLGNDQVYDINGHGTAVSGIIAAETDNALGIAGVAGTADVRVLPLQVANYAGESYISDVISAIDYAIDKGADVINLSLGSNFYSAAENAAVQRAIQAGVIVVASAGNDGNSDYSYPASYDNVISVGAVDSLERITDFSSYNDKVTVVAPGQSVYSCDLANSYGNHTGTSFSAPMVTGIAAVLRAVEPAIETEQVKTILESTANDRGKSGRDNYYGYGIVNMDEAVKQVSITPVEEIGMDTAKLHLSIGDTRTLTVSFSPLNASNQALTWVSSDSSVAKVDNHGRVTAVSIGQARISAVSEDGGKTALCEVSVENDVFAGILWASQEAVSPDKTWKVIFSDPLDDQGIPEGAIYVINDQGEEYPIEITISEEGSSLSINPLKPYLLSETYYLLINDSLLSASGETLAEAVKMKFVISS